MNKRAPNVPFDEPGLDPAPTESAAVVTVLEYAIAQNPDENWLVCCVCGCAGDCASFDRLAYGLLLLADGTLGRAAWCCKLSCASDKYSSFYLPWHPNGEDD